MGAPGRGALNAQAITYIWQWPVPNTAYVVDFYIPSHDLIIEVETPV